MWFWLFVVSIFANLFALLYVRWLLTSLTIINTDISNVSGLVQDFSSHVKGLHEMEMFYGDENLKSLIDHSNLLIEALEEVDLLLSEKEEEIAEEETTT